MEELIGWVVGEVFLFAICVVGATLLYQLKKKLRKGGGADPSEPARADDARYVESSEQAEDFDEKGSEEISRELRWSAELHGSMSSIMWTLGFLPLAAFVITAAVIGPEAGSSDEPNYLSIGAVLVVSAIQLIIAYMIRRTVARPEGPPRSGQVHWKQSPLRSLRRFGISASLRVAVGHGATPSTYAFKMTSVGVLCLSVGLYGFILFLVERDSLWLYLLVAVSAAALLLLRPREKDIADLGIAGK